MTLRDRVQSILDRNKKTIEQQDAEHQDLVQQPHYILEILQQPILGIPPSKRTVDDRRELLIEKLKKRWAPPLYRSKWL